MKLCGACNGKGVFANDLCEQCGGEGVMSMTTFVVGKINRKKDLEYSEVQDRKDKRNKIDKKNAVRSV